MNLLAWIKQRLLGSSKALWFYKRGIDRARLHDRQGAITDYTTSLEMNDGPPNLRAMALFNRALCHAAVHNEASAVNDLNQVMEMQTVPGDVRMAARQKLQRMQQRSERDDTA